MIKSSDIIQKMNKLNKQLFYKDYIKIISKLSDKLI